MAQLAPTFANGNRGPDMRIMYPRKISGYRLTALLACQIPGDPRTAYSPAWRIELWHASYHGFHPRDRNLSSRLPFSLATRAMFE